MDVDLINVLYIIELSLRRHMIYFMYNNLCNMFLLKKM